MGSRSHSVSTMEQEVEWLCGNSHHVHHHEHTRVDRLQHRAAIHYFCKGDLLSRMKASHRSVRRVNSQHSWVEVADGNAETSFPACFPYRCSGTYLGQFAVTSLVRSGTPPRLV